ncbi:MAG: hypothetical protein V4713_12165 [Pseudomonadota bacterium]
MSGLDFSELSDDQIVELAIGLAREAMSRNPALQAAMQQALVSERERADIAAKGAAAQKMATLHLLEKQSAQAAQEQARELLRQRQQAVLAGYLRAAAHILGKAVTDITVVWTTSNWGHGGPRLQINQGTAGTEARWHLLEYIEQTQGIHASPAARQKLTELQSWAREVCAAIRSLGIEHTTVIKGIEL